MKDARTPDQNNTRRPNKRGNPVRANDKHTNGFDGGEEQ
jgi:hypothetical protein